MDVSTPAPGRETWYRAGGGGGACSEQNICLRELNFERERVFQRQIILKIWHAKVDYELTMR